MTGKLRFLLLLFFFISAEAYSQFNYLSKKNGLFGLTVYLGNERTEKYETDIIHKNYLGDTLIYSFLGYHSSAIATINEFSTEKKLSDGLILPANTKRQRSLYMHYTLAKNADTCNINCKEALVNNWVGKSGLISAANLMLFPTEGKTYWQPDPHSETKQIEKRGVISMGRDSMPFFYSYHFKHPHGEWTGWLVAGVDTFLLMLPEHEANRKGKMMGVQHLQYDPGVIIKGNDRICAALDFGVNPVSVYLLKELPASQKMELASFLLTIISEL
jgi:hypothetical protein